MNSADNRPFAPIVQKLRAAGLRPTRQRMSLAKLLFEMGDRHVTAEQLHQEAGQGRIRVSLATVYNTLHQFTSAGLVREVAFWESVKDSRDPADFQAKADFTDVLAEDNSDWRIDLNDDVIGRWRGENGRAGAVTLVWGRPLVRGAVAATAELDAETVDQEVVTQERFTLLGLDALEGYGDDVYMEVKLWSRRAIELASESLYG